MNLNLSMIQDLHIYLERCCRCDLLVRIVEQFISFDILLSTIGMNKFGSSSERR